MASRMLLCVFCVLLFKPEHVLAQAASQSKYAAFVKEHKRFIDYASDFTDFVKSGEYEPSSGLWKAANEAGDFADAASTLLEIYDSLACPSDQAAVRAVIAREFAFYSKLVQNEIKLVNGDITYTKNPGVAAEAIRMRDDLRELQDLFDSTKVP